MFCEKYLEIQIKSYNKKVTTNFGNVENNSNKPPKKTTKCICLLFIVIMFLKQVHLIINKHFYKNVNTK